MTGKFLYEAFAFVWQYVVIAVLALVLFFQRKSFKSDKEKMKARIEKAETENNISKETVKTVERVKDVENAVADDAGNAVERLRNEWQKD